MSFRLIIPGLLWLGFMILLFITPTQYPETIYFGKIPARAFVHAMLFSVFVLVWMIAVKKQRSGQKIDRYSIPIVLTAAAFIMILAEVLGVMVGNGFRMINIMFDAFGAIFGLGVFALLYRTKW